MLAVIGARCREAGIASSKSAQIEWAEVTRNAVKLEKSKRAPWNIIMVDGLPWNLSLDGLLRDLGAAPAGLSNKAVERRLAEYGPNDALASRRRPLWLQILDRFANPLVLILLFASGLSAWTGEMTSFVIIVVIILLSVALDVTQQVRAENTVDALRRSVGLRASASATGEARRSPWIRLVPRRCRQIDCW